MEKDKLIKHHTPRFLYEDNFKPYIKFIKNPFITTIQRSIMETH